MRVWDIPPSELCNRHLVGEHAEIHAVWSVITGNKKGYASHPEVERWRGNLSALARRHFQVAAEMSLRGFRHSSPTRPEVEGDPGPVELIASVDEQRQILLAKSCDCLLRSPQTMN
jgi:hypothetical protein